MENPTLKIKISTAGTGKPFIKQLKKFVPEWDNCTFYINEDIEECDFWFIYGGLLQDETVRCPKENVVLITNEPPSVKRYTKKFTDQFGAIITSHNINHSNVIHSQQALPWWVGHKVHDTFSTGTTTYSKTYDELKAIIDIPKTKELSVIASNKTFTKGHRARYDFVQKLKEHFGEKADVFGIGGLEIEDKWDAIAPYKYTLVLENSSYRDYWTEKLTDAFLGLSYPIYSGCSNIYAYFPMDSLTMIDISKPEEAFGIIEKVLKENLYEKNLPSIKEARNLILEKYQLFPMLTAYANTHHTIDAKKVLVSIHGESPKQSFIEKLKDLPRKIKNR